MIESKLKKVRRLAHGNGKTEIGRRSDDANNQLERAVLTVLRSVICLQFWKSGKSDGGSFCSMLARRQELNTQLQVLIDAFLMALSLWAAYALRYCSTTLLVGVEQRRRSSK